MRCCRCEGKGQGSPVYSQPVFRRYVELEWQVERYSDVQTTRTILAALGIVAVIFGIPIMATLVAGQFGMSVRLIGWTTLVAMMVLAFQSRYLLARVLGERKLAPAMVRRTFKRR